MAGRQSQTVDAADAWTLLAAELADEVADDEHAAARREAVSSPAATAANRETWRFTLDLDRQVTCISFMPCSVPVDDR
jgi:hypothetical protein